MEEERGFEVVDRRRVGAEQSGPEATASEPHKTAGAEEAMSAGSGTEEPAAADMSGMMGEITVSGVLQWTTGLLANKAWIGMGLVPDPFTGRIQRDLTEARRAIDVVADLVKHLAADASPEEQRELQAMVSDLRLNFVRQSSQE